VPQQHLTALNKNVQVHEGLPENIENAQGLPCLFILDDLLNEMFSRAVCDLFTKGSHHRNLCDSDYPELFPPSSTLPRHIAECKIFGRIEKRSRQEPVCVPSEASAARS